VHRASASACVGRSSIAIPAERGVPARQGRPNIRPVEALAQPAAPPVPFLDLRLMHTPLRGEIVAALGEVLDSGAFVNGAQVRSFEDAFASYCGTRCCVGTSSGHDALRLALLAVGVEPGDEVIVPAMTFAATVEAVVQARGRPVLVDIGEDDYALDPDAVGAAVTSRTRFVLPVHLFGQMAPMRALRALGADRDLRLVEDACQAHGAVRDGIRAGMGGDAAAFSFYPGKNLGAMGDAGAVVTDEPLIADRIRALREHGQTAKYEHAYEGYTARLDTFQAAVLLQKLPFLDEWNSARQQAAALYGEMLAGVGDLRLPSAVAESTHVWHLYVVRTGDPLALGSFLSERAISTARHYPYPIHLSKAYTTLGRGPGSFPVAERLAAQGLSLPLYPGITEEQIARVTAAVTDFFHRGTRACQ
jgi:dTDP-4-amino-4,6-dideoxygalactose transaminase